MSRSAAGWIRTALSCKGQNTLVGEALRPKPVLSSCRGRLAQRCEMGWPLHSSWASRSQSHALRPYPGILSRKGRGMGISSLWQDSCPEMYMHVSLARTGTYAHPRPIPGKEGCSYHGWFRSVRTFSQGAEEPACPDIRGVHCSQDQGR